MNENKLIRAAQRGEKQAFEDLVAFYYPYISKFLFKLTGDRELTQDLTQETFIKLIRSIESYQIEGKATFSTYVMTISKHLYIDHLRKNKDIFIEYGSHLQTEINGIEEYVFDKLQFEEVINKLNDLPKEQSIAIKLKYLEQFTLEEIAQHFSCESKTVKSRIHNGVVKLRKVIKSGGNQNE